MKISFGMFLLKLIPPVVKFCQAAASSLHNVIEITGSIYLKSWTNMILPIGSIQSHFRNLKFRVLQGYVTQLVCKWSTGELLFCPEKFVKDFKSRLVKSVLSGFRTEFSTLYWYHSQDCGAQSLTTVQREVQLGDRYHSQWLSKCFTACSMHFGPRAAVLDVWEKSSV